MNKPITTHRTDVSNAPLHNTFTQTLAAIFIALCMAFVQQAQADTAAQLASQMNGWSGGGTGTLSATASGNTVTVTGNVANATTTLSLNIDATVTVAWQATLGGPPERVILDGGTGTFNMESGEISQTGGGRAVRNNGAGTLNITGGTILGNGGTGVLNYGSGTVNITGGTISATTGIAISNSSSGKITVSGASTKITSGRDGGTIEMSNGTLEITSGTVENTRATGNVIYTSPTAANTVNISGNVTATTQTAVRHNGAGALNITGGTISATTGTAIENASTGKITVSGSSVEITSQNTSATSGTIVLANSGNATDERLVIERGDVYNNAAGGNAIYNASTGAVTIGARGTVNAAATGRGIHNNSSGTVNVNGAVWASTGAGVYNASTGTVNVNSGGEISVSSGVAVHNVSTGKITVSGGSIYSSNVTATSGTIYLANGTLDITGGEVRNTSTNANARAVYNNGAGAVSVSGGTVSAANGYAIYKAGTGATALTGGAVYAWGISDADVIYGGYTASSGNPVVVAWDNTIGTTYTAFSNTALSASPSLATAKWLNKDGKAGIDYANGSNTGFIEVPGVTVNKATPTGITFPTAAGITYDPATTLSDIVLEGSTGGGTFAWASPSTVPTVTNSGYNVAFTPTDAENYTSLTQSVALAVSKANYDMSGIALIDATMTYNGQPHSIFVSGTLPAGLTVAYTGNAQTALGAHTVTASFTADANHNTPADMVATLTIVSSPTYTVTVVNGIGSSSYEAGEEVEITADIPPEGKMFDKWTSTDGITFANANAGSTTFTMPAKAVTVTATYIDLPPGEYAISVENSGHGIANASTTHATAGTEITLTAEANEGYVFKEWEVVSGGVTIANNKFTMPANNVVVMAVFEAEEETPIRTPQIASSNIFAYAMGNNIVLQNLPAGAKVEVFGLSGKLVYSNRVNPLIGGIGVQTISVQTKGMYIVKTGTQIFRVAVK